MKTPFLILVLAVLAGCSAQPEAPASQPAVREAPTPPAAEVMPHANPPAAAGTTGTLATATGVVTVIDGSARKITIAHEPVPALGWPAMTMGFAAPNVDLTGIQVGDKVAFEFATEGMNAAITRIDRQ